MSKLTREEKNRLVTKELLKLARTLRGIRKTSPVIFEALLNMVYDGEHPSSREVS